MFTVSVSHGALRALTMCAGQDPTRGMLTSVCIDTTTAGRVHLVTTDGHRMLIVNARIEAGNAHPGRYLVPFFECKSAKPAGKGHPILIDIEPKAGTETTLGGSFTIHGKTRTTGALLDGWQYPEWRRVTPEKTSGKLAQFNLGYLGDFAVIGELLGHKVQIIRHNGNGAALIELGADAFGILMPMRGEPAGDTLPDWLEAVTKEVAQAA